MSRKRSASTANECNNNVNETLSSVKKRRLGLVEQLQSNLTPKMIEPIKSPDGQATTRFGRMINRKSEKHKNHKNNPLTEQSQSFIRRKVRKVSSLHNINPQLRLVKFNESTVFAQSPIYKSISITKIGLNNNQFQTQLIDKSTNTKTSTNANANANIITKVKRNTAVMSDFYTNSVSNVPTTEKPTQVVANATTTTTSDSIGLGEIDFEDDLNKISYHLVRKRCARTESIQIIDEIDLTELTDHSDDDNDDNKTNLDEAERLFYPSFPTPEADSTSPVDASHNKTDSGMKQAIITETDIKIAKPISDCAISTSDPNAISFNDKAFSESTNDDCIITECSNIDSTDNWRIGQIVWAALPKFWPAIICKDRNHFQKGNFFFSFCMYRIANITFIAFATLSSDNQV